MPFRVSLYFQIFKFRGRPYMTSDARGRGGSAKSEFIKYGSLTKHLMKGGGGVKKGPKSSDVIYGPPLPLEFSFTRSKKQCMNDLFNAA